MPGVNAIKQIERNSLERAQYQGCLLLPYRYMYQMWPTTQASHSTRSFICVRAVYPSGWGSYTSDDWGRMITCLMAHAQQSGPLCWPRIAVRSISRNFRLVIKLVASCSARCSICSFCRCGRAARSRAIDSVFISS